jgi:hypothetical protein
MLTGTLLGAILQFCGVAIISTLTTWNAANGAEGSVTGSLLITGICESTGEELLPRFILVFII